EDGNITQVDIAAVIAANEALTILGMNADGINLDYLDEDGVTTQIDLSTVIDNLETLTILGMNADGINLDYQDEDGNITQVDIAAVIAANETLTTLVYDAADGSLTYTDEDGADTVIDLEGIITGTETLTTLVDNGDGTMTYTDEDGTANTINTTVVSNNTYIDDNTIDIDGDGNNDSNVTLQDVIDNLGDIIAANETVTTLVNADGTYTYTSENGATTTFNITQTGANDPITENIVGVAGDVYVDESTGDVWTYDGTTWVNQSAVANQPWFGTDDNAGATSNTEDVYMMGNIGVGTSTLSAGKVATFAGDVDIQGVLDPTKIIFSGDGSVGTFDPTTDGQYEIEFQEGNDLNFSSNTTQDILHLENAGNIGVGKSAAIVAGVDIVPVNGVNIGVQTLISHTGTDTHIGMFNTLSGTSTGTQFGVTNFIVNTSDGKHSGILNELTGSGSGDKYGTQNIIAPSAGGKHYAVYGEALNPGTDIWAGYFNGKVAVTDLTGTSETTDVIVTADASTGELRSTSISTLIDTETAVADKIVFSAEYAGAALMADGTDNLGFLTSDNTGAVNNWMNYYHWENTQTDGGTNDYDVILRFTLPSDFVAWETNAIVIDYTGTADANFTADVYIESSAAVQNSLGTTSGSGLTTWQTATVSNTGLTLTAGDTGIIILKMTASDVGVAGDSAIRLGDITLNYTRSKY
ncbi:MAG: hypothetical protein JKY22_07475, partial [Flavobacteriaceae bacterium]|nr:hypothetical protein [Flavobacteriaceae bacterium]